MTCQDHEVEPGNFMLMQTKDLAREPFQTISVDCGSDLFLRYRQTQTTAAGAASLRKHREVGVGRTPRVGKDRSEIRCGEKAGLAREALSGNLRYSNRGERR